MPDGQTQLGTHSMTEADLVHSAKRGDVTAFEELVRRHTTRVFCIAHHITRCRDDAEEVSQDTFLKAFLHLENFEEKAQFSTWLTRIALNVALTKVRSRRVKIGLDGDDQGETTWVPEDVADWRPNPEQLYSRSQLQMILREALERLPQNYSTVFILRDVQGLSVAETAAALQLTIPAVKTRLLRARLRLRENLSKHFISRAAETEQARANLLPLIRPAFHRKRRDRGCESLTRARQEFESESPNVRPI